jgi:putative ATPase
MKDLGYGKDYEYSHNYQGNFSNQEFLPDQINGTVFYEPSENLGEKKTSEVLKQRWPKYYK